jgi:hypothetical protein
MLGTTLWQHTKISTILKSPEELKDLECEKGQLSSQPPISYVLPTVLVTTKEAAECLSIKFPNGTIFNMSIFSRGNTEEYLAYVVAVLHLINQKGLDVQCRKLAKVDKLAGTLENSTSQLGPRMRPLRMTMSPARWRLHIPKRCSKKPRRLTTRLLPRSTSF